MQTRYYTDTEEHRVRKRRALDTLAVVRDHGEWGPPTYLSRAEKERYITHYGEHRDTGVALLLVHLDGLDTTEEPYAWPAKLIRGLITDGRLDEARGGLMVLEAVLNTVEEAVA